MCGRGEEDATQLSSEAAGGQTLHPPEPRLFWIRELFYLGLIRQEGTVRLAFRTCWGCSLLCTSLSISASTLHAAVVLLGRWQGVGRDS